MSAAPEIKPLDPTIPSHKISALQAALANSAPPLTDSLPSTPNATDHGITPDFATTLWQNWTEFSWSTAAAKIAQWPHYLATFSSPSPSTETDLSLHFVHQRSSNPNAIPLLMIHGWPGSFYEFSEVIAPLSDVNANPSFHVVVPSLPGFVFSSPPPRAGWTVKDTARIFNDLMISLGYSTYAVQAGDWGAMIARELGAQYSDNCRVMHLNWCPGAVPEAERGEESDRERKCREQGENWRTKHVGYAVLMRTRPRTVGWLAGTPEGLLGFVGEKYEEASNPSVHLTPSWQSHILTTLSLYYYTSCIATSALIYYENPRHDQFAAYCAAEENLIRCPFGYTSMGFDTAPNSERGAAMTAEEGKLVWYKERDYAGHFACLEDPEGMVEDVREVIGEFWGK